MWAGRTADVLHELGLLPSRPLRHALHLTLPYPTQPFFNAMHVCREQVGTLAYIVSFALGAGPVPGLLVPEITPTRLRGAPTPPSPPPLRLSPFSTYRLGEAGDGK